MIEEIKVKLADYFAGSKKDCWIGIQNFQGVREFTKIPLAPLTLIYGQNSAGKSTIHDAQQFIHAFFSGQWDSKTTEEHLNRWANHYRTSKPLTKGYLGKSDDVVISISSIIGDWDYEGWQSTHYQNRYNVTGLPDIVFNQHQDIPFRIDIHFSDSDNWHIGKISLFLGEDICAEYFFDEFEHYRIPDFYGLMQLNKEHFIYSLIYCFFKGGIEQFIKEPSFKNMSDDKWFRFNEIDVNHELQLDNLFCWSEVDECLHDRNPPVEILEFRTFILAMLQVPALSIAKHFNFTSVPPLRLIPAKQNAIFRFRPNFNDNKTGWEAIAKQICGKLINDKFGGFKSDTFACLDKINNFLAHDYFLNLGYEITGECIFLVPIELLMCTSIESEEIRKYEVEVHLKLIDKSNNQLVEIEDVGVGVSQVIPVLTAILLSNDWNWQSDNYKAYIQQPELHLHPKLQAQLADVFIASINSHLESGNTSTFIVESHSEHFLLRLLRRIRETHKSDIKNKRIGFYSKDLSVLYVDKSEDGSSKIFPLRISPDGEFIDRWPHGFFTERDGELFDE